MTSRLDDASSVDLAHRPGSGAGKRTVVHWEVAGDTPMRWERMRGRGRS